MVRHKCGPRKQDKQWGYKQESKRMAMYKITLIRCKPTMCEVRVNRACGRMSERPEGGIQPFFRDYTHYTEKNINSKTCQTFRDKEPAYRDALIAVDSGAKTSRSRIPLFLFLFSLILLLSPSPPENNPRNKYNQINKY